MWRLPRAEAKTAVRGEMRRVLEAIEREIPADAAVGVRLTEDDWDYPHYGERLERRLLPLTA